jgi:hypothetical protein
MFFILVNGTERHIFPRFWTSTDIGLVKQRTLDVNLQLGLFQRIPTCLLSSKDLLRGPSILREMRCRQKMQDMVILYIHYNKTCSSFW